MDSSLDIAIFYGQPDYARSYDPLLVKTRFLKHSVESMTNQSKRQAENSLQVSPRIVFAVHVRSTTKYTSSSWWKVDQFAKDDWQALPV